VVAATRGFGCGHAVERNRAEEFTGTGSDVRDVIDAIRQLSREIDSALPVLTPEALGRRTRPSPELWGTGTPREISGREALVESIRHAALHLGELRLTRDLAKQHG
jgi:hypothetical protein